MSSIGNALKEAREKKSISLDDVHTRVKIHPRVLQLLEEDRFDKLPSPLFAKSFSASLINFARCSFETPSVNNSCGDISKEDVSSVKEIIKLPDDPFANRGALCMKHSEMNNPNSFKVDFISNIANSIIINSS